MISASEANKKTHDNINDCVTQELNKLNKDLE